MKKRFDNCLVFIFLPHYDTPEYRLIPVPIMRCLTVLSSAAPLAPWLAFQDSHTGAIVSKSRCPRGRLQRMVIRHCLILIRSHVCDCVLIFVRLPDPVTLQMRNGTKKTANPASCKSHSHNNWCTPTQNSPYLLPYTHDHSQEHCKYELEIQHWDSHYLK